MKNKRHQPHRLIMGKNCIEEVLHHLTKRLVKIYTSREDDPLVGEAKKKHIAVEIVKKHKLYSLVQSESHQGFVAEVHEPFSLALTDLLHQGPSKEKSVILMLDSITDPQNVGALIRAAECFGVDAVIWSKNRGPKVTPVVSKASVGASEFVPIVKVSNLVDTILRLQEIGYSAITAEVDESAENLHLFKFPSKTLLIMGSEGKGVRPLISKKADHKIYIPMQGKLSSLNVSQATSVILSKVYR